MILQTERLVLRELTEEDYPALNRVLGDPEVMRYYPHPFGDKEVKNWITRNRERYRVLGFGLWAVCLRDTGELIGDCGLTMQNINGVICPEIGYHIRADKQRNGYAREAAAAVRDWTFKNTPFLEVYSYMKATNTASAATAMSYGCRFVCDYPDAVNEVTRVYRLKKSEFEQEKNNE